MCVYISMLYCVRFDLLQACNTMKDDGRLRRLHRSLASRSPSTKTLPPTGIPPTTTGGFPVRPRRIEGPNRKASGSST